MSVISIVIGEKYYNKDPRSSDLGKRIVTHSIHLLDELGYEEFTFKKLAQYIDSTEASIYRYFDNKHILLLYLATYYWSWISYLIDIKTHHLTDATEQLRTILRIICNVHNPVDSVELPGIDVKVLRRVVGSEADKTYLTKRVDEINNQGLFKGYKELCHKIALVILRINPKYKYPHALVSTVLEASNQQLFFAQHLPSLTEVSTNYKTPLEGQVYKLMEHMVLNLIS